MAEKLSLLIRETLHKYYMHRQRQTWDGWDKEGDLDLIFKTAGNEGWTVEAVAGHFWFRKKTMFGTHIIEITETTLSTGGYSNIKDDQEPLGIFSTIAKSYKAKVDKKWKNGG